MNFRVMPVFIEVLQGTIANLGAAVRMSWPWLLLLVPLQVAVSLYQARGLSSAPQEFAALVPHLVSIAYWLAAFIAGASIAVNWHRFLLLEEEASERLRLDRPVWRYLGNCVLLFFPMVLLMVFFLVPLTMVFAAMFLSDGSEKSSLSFDIAMMLAMVVPIAVLQRLSLKFPAIAIGRDDYGFRDSWRDTREHFLRIIGFTLLTTAVTSPVAILLTYWTPDMQQSLAAPLVHAVLYTAWTLFVALFTINTLTVFYAIFAEGLEV